MVSSAPTLFRARIYLIVAAILWSSGSLFIRLLKEPTHLDVHTPGLTSIQIAVFRALFAGLFMLPLVRWSSLRFRPSMLAMVLTFACMSGSYLTALDQGAAANAIFLQFTAPFWVYVISVYFLGERSEARATQAILIGLAGSLVIVIGGWPSHPSADQQAHEVTILGLGISSGIFYAGVILFLTALRDHDTAWLVCLNNLGSAMVLAVAVLIALGPGEWWAWLTTPSARQLAFLAVYGIVQMAMPYWLFSRGLRTVGPQEAALITLLEPILNPVWAFLITPEKDRVTLPMMIGGSLILTALIWRYVPRNRGDRRGFGGAEA